MISKVITLVVAFPICIFFGVMFIALGLGSYFPQVNYVTASSFVCPNGTLASDIDLRANIRLSSNNVHYDCINRTTGAKTSVTFPVLLFSGAIYGLVLFAIVFAIMSVITLWRSLNQTQTGLPLSLHTSWLESSRLTQMARNVDKSQPGHPADPVRSLKELKEMLASGLITQDDYDQKKKELLGRM